jgi:toxin HigB-1
LTLYGKVDITIDVRIISIRHKGLARFIERNDSSKLDQRIVGKLRVQVTFLEAMEHDEECRNLPFWKAHQLNDDRWSFPVTANYRLTFAVDNEAQEINILDLEDYR